jgi:hypothetical protein
MEAIVDYLRNKYINEVISETNLPMDIIMTALLRYKYDVKQTIISLEDEYCIIKGERKTSTAYKLYRYKDDKTLVVNSVSKLILHKYKLKRPSAIAINSPYYLKEEELLKLNEYHICVVALNEWQDCFEDENFDCCLRYNINLTIQQLIKIQLPTLAAALKLARDINNEINAKYDFTIIGNYQKCYDEKQKDDYYKEAENFFYDNKHLINEKLYDFIKNNVNEFP